MSTLRSIFINGSKVGRLTDDQVGSFTHCIVKSNILLECLSLSYHHITDAGLGYICSALMYAAPSSNDPQQSMRLEVLDLEGNLITAKGIPALRLHSNEDCPLLSLNLSYNKIDEEGGMIIAEALSVNRVLRQLLANNCGFTVNATIAIATSLSRLSKNGKSVLEELQIDRPNLARAIGEDCVDHFSRLCASPNSGLMALSLRHYGCGDLGAKLVAQSLSRRDSMVSINLECNKIGVAGAEALASYLIAQAKKGTNSVRSLRLSYNCIGTEGAIALAEALTQTNTLAELTLKNNQIGPPGLLALGEALFRNNTLQVLSVFGNDFETDSGKLFMSVLERAPYVGLSLDVLSYEVDGTFMVAEAN
jgi:Ran GTPase-activating protein (RanGAP) involved in mRNA processing and transport